MHNFEHDLHKALTLIQDTGLETIDIVHPLVVDKAEELLGEIKRAISLTLNTDVAVHIKLFEENANGEKVGNRYSNLITYQRIPSEKELRRRRIGKFKQRDKTEKFKIILAKKGKAENLIKQNPPPEDDPDNRINSAYNYVFSETEHNWICNDLECAEAEGKYFNNCSNYQQHKWLYQSLAVFLINPRVPDGSELKDCPYGLLIIDSHEKMRFDAVRMQIVAGFFAHRMYDFFRVVAVPKT